MTEDKVEAMLALIKERLSAYSIDETINRLHSYSCNGPTIEEMFSDAPGYFGVEAIPASDAYESNHKILFESWHIDGLDFSGAANDNHYRTVDDCCFEYSLAA